MPSSDVPSIDIEHLDKVVHIGMYAVFSILIFGYAIKERKTDRLKWMVVCFLLASGYGLLMEILQHYYFKSRSFEFYDIISNIIGSLIGVIFANNFLTQKSRDYG